MTQQIFFDYGRTRAEQRAFVKPEGWQPHRLPERLPEGLVALDFETKDPGISEKRGSSWAFPNEGFVTGCAFSYFKGAPAPGAPKYSFYIGIDHAEGNSCTAEDFWRWLRVQSRRNIRFVMANAIYDLGWMAREDITPLKSAADVLGMAAMVDENQRSYSLNAVGHRYLQRGKSGDDLAKRAAQAGILKPMENMNKMPAWMVAPYAIDDAELTLDLYPDLANRIAAENMGDVFSLECEMNQVCVDMRKLGTRVDLDRAQQLRDAFKARCIEAEHRIHAATGVAVTPFDNVAIVRALKVENPQVELDRTATGHESVRRAVLETMNTPVAKDVMEMRGLDKLISTFIDGALMKYAVNGRVHCEFHPLRRSDDNDDSNGTVSGRLSSSNFNIQNIPARTADGMAIRECFIAEDGEQWLKADYASQEPRLQVHFASLAKLRGAEEMVKRYNDNPDTDLHGECATLMSVGRKPAKTINLGIAYGMMGASLCKSLGLPTVWETGYTGKRFEKAGPEGQALLDRHHAAVPFVRDLFDLTKKAAEVRGYVRDIMGRRAHFVKNEMGDGKYMFTHAACNRVIQMSAASQMKRALVLMRRAGIAINLTVHDEAGKSLPMGDQGEIEKGNIREIMETAFNLVVPVRVDMKVGPTWALG